MNASGSSKSSVKIFATSLAVGLYLLITSIEGTEIVTTPASAPAVNLAERFAHGTAGGGDKLLSDDNIGRPVLVRPLALETGIQTSFGQSDAIRAEWVFLDTFAQSGQAEIQKGLIFPSAVVRALGDVISNPRVDFTIGIVAKAASAKPGQSPAWLLNDAPEWVDTAVAAVTASGMI